MEHSRNSLLDIFNRIDVLLLIERQTLSSVIHIFCWRLCLNFVVVLYDLVCRLFFNGLLCACLNSVGCLVQIIVTLSYCVCLGCLPNFVNIMLTEL